MSKKHGDGGWYHISGLDGFGGIYYFDSPPSTYGDNPQAWNGPFATFGGAKRDAISHFEVTIREARNAIAAIRATRKPRKGGEA